MHKVEKASGVGSSHQQPPELPRGMNFGEIWNEGMAQRAERQQVLNHTTHTCSD
jgi:hypothetical protein